MLDDFKYNTDGSIIVPVGNLEPNGISVSANADTLSEEEASAKHAIAKQMSKMGDADTMPTRNLQSSEIYIENPYKEKVIVTQVPFRRGDIGSAYCVKCACVKAKKNAEGGATYYQGSSACKHLWVQCTVNGSIEALESPRLTENEETNTKLNKKEGEDDNTRQRS